MTEPRTRHQASARDRLNWAINAALLDHVSREHGDEAVVEKPISPNMAMLHRAPADYRHGVVAARFALGQARGAMLNFALAARSEGVSWADLADPLGIRVDPDPWDGKSGDRLAFELVSGIDPDSYRSPLVGWYCGDCKAWVNDHGPGGHPDECETGHLESCERRRREVAAFERKHGS